MTIRGQPVPKPWTVKSVTEPRDCGTVLLGVGATFDKGDRTSRFLSRSDKFESDRWPRLKDVPMIASAGKDRGFTPTPTPPSSPGRGVVPFPRVRLRENQNGVCVPLVQCNDDRRGMVCRSRTCARFMASTSPQETHRAVRGYILRIRDHLDSVHRHCKVVLHQEVVNLTGREGLRPASAVPCQ